MIPGNPGAYCCKTANKIEGFTAERSSRATSVKYFILRKKVPLTSQTILHLVSLQSRLVEVNGVPVVNATVEELTELLLQGPSAQIVVLRHPPVGPTSLQHPPLPPVRGTAQNISLARAAVAMETPAQRKVIVL